MSRVPKEAKTFVLNKSPVTAVNLNLGEEKSTFKLINKPIRDLRDDEVLVKTLYLSNDPTQRAWIQKGLNAERMYVDPVLEGQAMKSSGLGRVVASKLPGYNVGDVISCALSWQDYSIVKKVLVYNKIPQTDLPMTMFLDVLGMTGLTAYFGLLQVAQLKKTDTIVISAASGATGSMCVQIAKKVIGCKRVIGISGGAEKCRYVESIGADVCVDYKDPKFEKNMKQALGEEKYCDVFFDGVGGRILDTMLQLVKPFGQVIACGAIAGYNDFRKSFVSGWGQIITNRLTVKGFIILDFQDQYEQGVKDIAKWIQEGKIKVDNSSFTLVDLSHEGDFRKIPETWGILFSDKKGPGKLLTKL